MKKSIILSGIAVMVFFISGCGKHASKHSAASLEPEEAMEDMNSTLSNEVTTNPQASAEQTQGPANNMVLTTMPAAATGPSEPSAKPTPQEIQQSLKNAGVYTGKVDGVLGPRTKKAVRDFQTQNSLTADGRVGPQTWTKLQPYLHQAPAAAPSANPD